MGVVYLARDPNIEREIALKTVRFDIESQSFKLEEAKARFLKEAKIEYVSRSEGNARTKVQTFLNRLLMQAPPETERLLIASFFHRNRLGSFDLLGNMDRLDTLKLADLLTSKDAQPDRPALVSKVSDARKIDTYLNQRQHEAALN